MNGLMQLALVMNMVDKTSQPLKTVAKSADKTTEAIEKTSKSLSKFSIISEKIFQKGMKWAAYGQALNDFSSQVANKFKAPVDSFMRLENGMSSLKVAMMDSTGAVSDKFKKLSDLAVDLSNKLPTTAEEMHKVAAAGIAMGMNEDIMINGGLEAASNFAMAATGGDFNRSMEITNALQKSWKIDASDLTKSLDLMARAKSVGVNTEDMLKALAKTGLQAQGRGETGYTNLEKMIPYLTTILADGTMSGDVVGTNFSKMMSKALTADTAKLDKTLKTQLKLNFVKNGKFAGLENMVNELQKLSTLDASTQAAAIKQLFGDSVELQSIVFKLISEGNTGVQNMAKSMQKFASIQNKVDESQNTLSAKWAAFTGTLDTSLGKLVEPIKGDLKDLTDILNSCASAIGKLNEKFPDATKWILKLSLIVGGTAFVFGRLVYTLGMFMMYLPPAIKLIGFLAQGFVVVSRTIMTVVIPKIIEFSVLLATKLWGGLVAAATASKAFAVKLFTVHIPAVFSAIAAHGLFALAVAAAAVGIAGLAYAIYNLVDGTTEAGNDLRVLTSGFDGLWAVLKKIAKFLVYFVTNIFTLGHGVVLGTAEDEEAIDNIGKREKVGRFAEVTQPPASAGGGDTNNNVEGDVTYNQVFNIDAKNTDFKQILREIKEMVRLDNSRKYAVAK